MREPTWLLTEFVVAAHNMALDEHGGPSGIRDENMLDSALSRPKNNHGYDDSATLYDLAAAYSFGIAMDHPFVDGNKRTALIAAMVFLEINGISIDAPEPETASIYEMLAAGKLKEAELARWLEDQEA